MAVVREDKVKLSFEFDNREANKANDAVDDLVEKTQELGGPNGTGKAEKGFKKASKEAKKFGDTKLDKLSDGVDKIVKSVGKFTLAAGKKAMKGFAVGVTAGTTALAALGTAAVKGYAEYEQLIGGVDTLFGSGSQSVEEYAASIGKSVDDIKAFQKANGLVVDGIIGPKTSAAIQAQYEKMAKSSTSAADLVLKNANDAYKTAGLSANEYMSTVTSFSASLINSVGGDTAKAAKLADQAVIDMADNANKMGTDIGMIQNAYQGFAKQNYTMLDNLKLGYGGTKQEMERLLKDAEKLTGKKYNLSNFADVTEAIHAIQVEMGIAGTTAKEASETIQGSALAMKSAWSNFLTGMANEDADFNQLTNNLVDSVITFADNLIPRIQTMLPRLVRGLAKITKSLGKKIPGMLNTLIPTLVESGVDLAKFLFSGIVDNLPMLKELGINIIGALYKGITGKKMPTGMFVKLRNIFTKIEETVKKIVAGISDFAQKLWVALGPALEWVAGLALDAFSWIGDNINTLLPILGSLLGALLAFKAVKSITGIIGGVKGAFSGLLGLFGKSGKSGGAAASAGGASSGGGMLGIKNVASAMGGIAVAIGGIALIIAVFGALKKIPGYDDFMAGGGDALKQLVGIIEDIGLVGGAFVAFVAVVGALGGGAAAANGMLAVATVLGGMEAVVLAFGAIAEIPGIDKFMQQGGEMLSELCRIIGEMAGSIIGGIGEGITNSLASIGDNITAFAQSISPAITAFSLMDSSGLKDFASAFGEFALVMAGDKILTFLTGETDYAALGTDLSTFATNLSGFLSTMATVPTNAFTNATALFECLSGISNLPNTGGLVGWFAGEVDFGAMALGMRQLATAAPAFNTFATIPEAGFTSLSALFEALAGVKSMPASGGIVQWFAGDKTAGLNAVASQLPGVATDIALFFAALGGRTDFSPIKNLFDTLSGISIDTDAASKGFLGLGTSDLAAVGTELSNFAANASGFFSAVSSYSASTISDFVGAVGGANTLPTLLAGIDGTIGTMLSTMATNLETSMKTMKTNLNASLLAMVLAIRSKSTAFQSAGVAIMQGLNNGINSMRSTLIATANSIANSIRNTINTAMDINSPSRVTYESGQFIGQGLAGGMRNMIPDIQVAARDVSNATIPYDGYSPDSSSTYYHGGNSEVTTISPVFNLTVSGTTDDRATARKVKRYVAEAIRETFESMGRKVVTQ